MYKLTTNQVKDIREMRKSGETYFAIGEKHNISFQHAQAICSNKRKQITINESNNENEIWKTSISYPCIEVSNLGRVRRLETKRILKPYQAKTGYLVIGFSYNGKKITKLIHRIIAEAFLGEPKPGYTVNHKDGNKENNKLENLEYLTHSDNDKHAYSIGLKNAKGKDNGRSKLTEENVLNMRKLHKEGVHYKDIAKEYNISNSHADAIIKRKFWNHI